MSRFVLTVVFLPSCLFFAACKENAKSKQRLFSYCSEAAPTTFNPQKVSDGASMDASSQPLFNRLLSFNKKNMKLESSLALSWNVSPDGKVYTFKLREGVGFHETPYFKPKRKLNAEDVVFTFNSMMNPQSPFYSDGYEYFRSTGLSENLKSVKKIDDKRVAFYLKKPDATFLSLIAMDFASIHSKNYAEQLLEEGRAFELDTKPIGTGPFKFKDLDAKEITYLAHKDYFEGPSKIKVLKFIIQPDGKERLRLLKKGACDFVKNSRYEDTVDFYDDENFHVVERAGLNVAYIAMNMRKKIFQNKNLRFAIAHALNRSAYISSVYSGKATLAETPLPPVLRRSIKVQPIDYNISKAKKFMEESGLELPIKIKLWTLPISRPYNPHGRKMAELIKEDLRQIGIELESETFDWFTFLEKSRKGEHEMIQYGWSGDIPDASNYLQVLLTCPSVDSGSNLAGFCDKAYDKIIAKAQVTLNSQKRNFLYGEALKIFSERLPWVPIAHANVFSVFSTEVKGYEKNPFGTESFYRFFKKSWEAKK